MNAMLFLLITRSGSYSVYSLMPYTLGLLGVVFSPVFRVLFREISLFTQPTVKEFYYYFGWDASHDLGYYIGFKGMTKLWVCIADVG